MSTSDYRFEVAISFAGDSKRAKVRTVAEYLQSKLGNGKVFFDEWFEEELAGHDAQIVLQNYYRKLARLVVTCVCERYNEKPWTQDEWRAIQAFERDLRDAGTDNVKRLRFLPLRFGDGEIDGLFSTAIVPDVRDRSAEAIAELILKRLGLAKQAKTATVCSIPEQDSRVAVLARTAIGVNEHAQLAPSKLTHVADRLFGRDDELAKLDSAWSRGSGIRVISIVAWGGAGKTSLVAKWAATLLKHDFDGAAYFDWSFYSQSSRNQLAGSGDQFIRAALEFFGDRAMARSLASAWDKGARLAHVVAQRRTLLVLDGLETLQRPPGPQTGEIKDQAVSALLRGLAANNSGLCLVTSRERVADLAQFRESTAPEWELDHLSIDAGAALLVSLGVTGAADEIRRLVTDVQGHALTLQLFGKFLHDAYKGDIAKRNAVRLEDVNKEHGERAFRVMDAYVKWFGKKGAARALAALRLLGLFDRPADVGCLAALREAPVIPGLTEPLIDLTVPQWDTTVTRLTERGLIAEDEKGRALDTHPLIREYFAKQLRKTRPGAFKAAHARLFDHLCGTTPHRPDDLAGLEPLYQAVAHGCQADLPQRAFDEVYWDRIQRGKKFFPTKRLGATGADLACVSAFFSKPWHKLRCPINFDASYEILDGAAEYLHMLGRLSEALQAAKEVIRLSLDSNRPANAAGGEILASEICLSMGRIADARCRAIEARRLADDSGDPFARKMSRVLLAMANHQRGDFDAGLDEFHAAERIQRGTKNGGRHLLSIQGCEFCELILDKAAVTRHDGKRRRLVLLARARAERCYDEGNLLVAALSQFEIERSRILDDSLSKQQWEQCAHQIAGIIASFQQAGAPRYQFRAYLVLAGAWARTGNKAGASRALEQAQQIAERGPMPLCLSDIHLQRARIFRDRTELAEAAKLIRDLEYGRRYVELAETEVALAGD